MKEARYEIQTPASQPASYNCKDRRPAFYFSEQQGFQAKDSSHRGNAYFLAV